MAFSKARMFFFLILACLPFNVICDTSGYVRLVNGDAPNKGRVEIFYDNQWGTICDDTWDSNDARVVCRQLGYGTATNNATGSAYYGQGTGPILLGAVFCDGSEFRLDNCSHSDWYSSSNCLHSEDAGVECGLANGDIRLVGGLTADEGRVEVYYGGKWGTVCDNYWGVSASEVVCRQLGYTDNLFDTYPYPETRYFGEGSGRIWLDNVQCGSWPYRLSDCSHRGWGVEDCEHSQDVGVSCNVLPAYGEGRIRLVTGETLDEGAVEIYHDGVWGTICSYWSSQEATVVCRQLGYDSGHLRTIYGRYFDQESDIFWDPYNIYCTGQEDHLTDCPYSRSSWAEYSYCHRYVGWVTCSSTVTTPSSQPTLAMVSRGIGSSESGNAWFGCHLNQSDTNAPLTAGRYLWLPLQTLVPPPSPIPFAGDGAVDISVYDLDVASYGAFFCEVVMNGRRIRVVTIFHKSDATFYPEGGKTTRTVSAGDLNVTLEMVEAEPVDENSFWRHHSFIYSSEGTTLAQNTTVTYTFPDAINTTHAGIYELQYSNNTRFSYRTRAGYIRLIVRACPAGRYDTSSGCTRLCQSCINGGICDDLTGECVCAPGFRGANCEIACARYHFGDECELSCENTVRHESESGCEGLQVCVPDPHGCSCVPGYKGFNCDQVCEAGEFGAGCSEQCHCLSGGCDPYSGVCTGTSTDCSPGWTGPNCQDCLPGRYGSDCSGLLTLNIEQQSSYTNGNQRSILPGIIVCEVQYASGDGHSPRSTVDPVVMLYRKHGDSQESLHETGTSNSSQYYPMSTGLTYRFEVAFMRPLEEFTCEVSDVTRYRSEPAIADAHCEHEDPLGIQPVIVTSTTNETIDLTLTSDIIAWANDLGLGAAPTTYDLFYSSSAPSGAPNDSSPASEGWMQAETGCFAAASCSLSGLVPDSNYSLAVSAWTQDLEGFCFQFTVKTECLCPLVVQRASQQVAPWVLFGLLLVVVVVLVVLLILGYRKLKDQMREDTFRKRTADEKAKSKYTNAAFSSDPVDHVDNVSLQRDKIPDPGMALEYEVPIKQEDIYEDL